MATFRDHPYESCNFLVEIGGFDADDPRSMFCRVDFPGAIIDSIDYRNGNDRTQEVRKQPGLAKYGNLVLHRGLIGSTDLWDWWKLARQGQTAVDRDVRVTLLDDERNPVWRWKFKNAFPVKYQTSSLDASADDVVIEELTLTFDSMDIE